MFSLSNEREVIARQLLQGIDEQKSTPERVWAYCPMHSEKTPGGAFSYNVEEDIAGCYSCGGSTDLIGLFNLSQGRETGDPEGMSEFIKEYCSDVKGKGIPKRKEKKKRPRWLL